MPDPGGQWPPRSISLRLFFLLKAVPAAREGRIKRCAGPNHLLTTPPPNNPIGQRRAARQASILHSLDRFRLVIMTSLQSLLIPSRYETVIQLAIG